MDRTTYDNIFMMLLNGDLLLRFGFLICEEDADPLEEPDGAIDQYYDLYYLIGLKENPDATSKHSGKSYSSWIYASSTPGKDYKSTDWKDELVDKFLESISATDFDEVLFLAGKYDNAPKHFHSINNSFYVTT